MLFASNLFQSELIRQQELLGVQTPEPLLSGFLELSLRGEWALFMRDA